MRIGCGWAGSPRFALWPGPLRSCCFAITGGKSRTRLRCLGRPFPSDAAEGGAPTRNLGFQPITDLNVELIAERDELAAIEPAWRELAESRGNAFVTPEWFAASIESDGAWSPLVAVARNREGEVLGVMPFARRRDSPRWLLLAGPVRCDILHPASREEHEAEVAAAAAEAITGILRRPVLSLGRAGPAEDWCKAMELSPRRALVAVTGTSETYPYVDLAGLDWDSYMARRSRNLRSQIGRKMRNLRRDHDVEIRLSSEASLERDLTTLFRLHDLRWRERRGTSSVDDRLRAFHRKFARSAMARGWLRLLVIEIDGSPGAAWYGWNLGGRWSYYQAGFDPRWNNYSIGLLAMAESIRVAVSESASEYDMLLGGEGFKFRFADRVRNAQQVVLCRPADPVRFVNQGRSLIRRGWRRLPNSVRERVRAGLTPIRSRQASR